MRSSVLVAVSLLIASSFLSCRRSAPQNDAALIAPLKHDLQAGMTRDKVEKYLADHHYRYSASPGGTTYRIFLAEEKGDGWFCNRSSIYADVDFAANSLTNVRTQKIRHCF